jgi:hypothetical protein
MALASGSESSFTRSEGYTASRMSNASIELHDSRVTGIREEGLDVVIDLEAYVHVSEGAPGVDVGTGWSRRFQITVRGGVIRRDFLGEALRISDSVLRIGARELENAMPCEVDVAEAVALELVGDEGKLTVVGDGLRIEPTSAAVYVEAFPGTKG